MSLREVIGLSYVHRIRDPLPGGTERSVTNRWIYRFPRTTGKVVIYILILFFTAFAAIKLNKVILYAYLTRDSICLLIEFIFLLSERSVISFSIFVIVNQKLILSTKYYFLRIANV